MYKLKWPRSLKKVIIVFFSDAFENVTNFDESLSSAAVTKLYDDIYNFNYQADLDDNESARVLWAVREFRLVAFRPTLIIENNMM